MDRNGLRTEREQKRNENGTGMERDGPGTEQEKLCVRKGVSTQYCWYHAEFSISVDGLVVTFVRAELLGVIAHEVRNVVPRVHSQTKMRCQAVIESASGPSAVMKVRRQTKIFWVKAGPEHWLLFFGLLVAKICILPSYLIETMEWGGGRFSNSLRSKTTFNK
ncbi:unnamed protein product, partial [Nesidiocoris tenuis]